MSSNINIRRYLIRGAGEEVRLIGVARGAPAENPRERHSALATARGDGANERRAHVAVTLTRTAFFHVGADVGFSRLRLESGATLVRSRH